MVWAEMHLFYINDTFRSKGKVTTAYVPADLTHFKKNPDQEHRHLL